MFSGERPEARSAARITPSFAISPLFPSLESQKRASTRRFSAAC
jgi:hypothetical protein